MVAQHKGGVAMGLSIGYSPGAYSLSETERLVRQAQMAARKTLAHNIETMRAVVEEAQAGARESAAQTHGLVQAAGEISNAIDMVA